MANSDAVSTETEFCPLCRNRGKNSGLGIFWISLKDAVKLCQDSQCTYPLGIESSQKIMIEKSAMPRAPHRKKIKTCSRKKSVQRINRLNSSLSLKDPSFTSPANSSTVTDDDRLSQTFDEILSELSSLDSTPAPSISNSENSLDVFSSSSASLTTDDPFDIESFLDSCSPGVIDSSQSLDTTSTVASEPVSIPEISQPTAEEKPPIHLSPSEVTAKTKSVAHKTQKSPKKSAKTSLPSESVVLNPPLLESCSIPCDISNSFLQWRNVDNLCWLDVSMKLLAHCQLLSDLMTSCSKNTVLHRLMTSYSKAQVMLRKGLQLNRCLDFCKRGRPVQLETSVGRVLVPTGGGGVLTNWATVSISQLDKEEKPTIDSSVSVMDERALSRLATREDQQARALMTDLREDMWRELQPSLRCMRGQKDSPVFAIPLLLNEVEKDIALSYTWRMVCQRCSHSHVDPVQRIVPTLPSTPSDFSMQQPCFIRSCLHCKQPGQRMNMHINRMPASFFVHFVEGLHHSQITDYDFCHGDDQYAVKGVIQFKKCPDHFVAWIRNPVENTWMECDDLKGTLCRFLASQPPILPSQMHLLMWERQTPGNGYIRPPLKAQKKVAMTTMQLLHKSASSVPKEDRISRMKERFLKSFSSSSTPLVSQTPHCKPKVTKKHPQFTGYVSLKAQDKTPPKVVRKPASKQKSVSFAEDKPKKGAPLIRKRKAEAPANPKPPKQTPGSEDTVFKLEISHPTFSRVITLKSPVKTQTPSSSKGKSAPSPDLDEIFQKLRDTLKDDQSIASPPPPTVTPPPAHTKRVTGSLCPPDWLSYAAGINPDSLK
ncbi:hypothetical protein CAPTEDRAFT_227502 [Capitella teleta]|uniref:Ubiquitin-specific peptidase-like SUMO isopeptidase domain-containing protein n=1 Tax=Capitella teleta TaxID=283909 RepID=R7UIW6_CAPTE|nr:hypothetical protein CAPTEDRAFT_227502 [Capitella teleta]|eukprot:ELU06115.1 hypothetical protein CAPTEDRAFT_227502 [Capitella teleta]